MRWVGLTREGLQPYVTELDLRHSLIPDEIIEDLLHSMPPHTGPDAHGDVEGEGEGERVGAKFDYVRFMERITRGAGSNGEEEEGKKKTKKGGVNGTY